ncbi:MAG: OmpA family protein [Candidatus Kapabacteria bacterium]|nr:OmpA family protein [Ignavibacteriota bacterium]MCW5885187.1 OmpA family protein [Candidatus Kapabacteria bacterium]
MKRILAALLLITLFAVNDSISEDRQMSTNIGIFGGLNINMHSPEFYTIQGGDGLMKAINKSSTTFGGNFGLIGNFPLNNTFVITGRLGYNMLGGELKDYMDDPFDASLSMLEITPGMQFHNLISGTDLYFLAGLELGVPLQNKYTYPSSLENDVDIPDANTRVALALGVGYIFEISKNIFLTPEVSYRIPFSEVSASDNFTTWNVPQLRAGISLTFGFGKEKETEVVQKTATVDVGFKEVRAYDRNGNVKPASKISVEEVQYAEQFPILPYVFFNELSDEPNTKTQTLAGKSNEAGTFQIESLTPVAEKINSSTLDIVGERMQKDKNIAIRIVGTLDGRSEANNRVLAQKRAEFAKNYLVNTYSISPDRITAEAGNLPGKPSSLRDPMGLEENRRIEIYPLNSNSALFEPIVIQSDRQRIASPDVIEFVPFAESNDSIAGWELEVMQSGKLIKKYAGEGIPEPMQWSIMPNDLAANEIPVDYTFKAWTINDQRSTANGTLPVEYFSITRKKTEERADRTISKFSLMLFDFNSPDVSELDKRIILNSIVPEIKFNSTVQVYGYTDIIGDADYNKKLALQRATNVQDFLKTKVKGAKYEVFGVGESVQIFDNKTPTGRQLSRTVQVYVITPKN